MNLLDELSPPTRKKIVRGITYFGIWTLISSIAIGMIGGLIVAEETEKHPHLKGETR